MNQFQYSALLFATCMLLAACDMRPPSDDGVTTPVFHFVTVADIEERQDGLTYHKGAGEPYNGPVIRTHKERGLRYFAMYQNGLLNGPEITFYDNGLIRRITDFRDGIKDRNRDYYENGHPWRDAMFADQFAWGAHRKWHENGKIGFVGVIHQDEESMKWHGHITDHDEDGRLVVDAIFDEGKYIGGVFPLEENPKPKPSGQKWIWDE